jgi:predicted kinase
MDLDREGYPQLARRLLKDYIQRSGDRDVMVLLDFYKCYRAFVRAKVNCFRLKQGGLAGEEALVLHHQVELFMALAYEYAQLFSRPTIWVVCGMIASGKSTVARALADALQTKTLRSDVIRKELFVQQRFQSRVVDFEEGLYSGEATSLTYGKLLLEAQDEIEGGDSVILDATFSREYQRRDVWRLAADMDANIVFIECRCREDVIRRRLAERAQDGDVSDARLKHLDAFKKRYEAFDAHYNAIYFQVDTEKPLKENLAHILSRTA